MQRVAGTFLGLGGTGASLNAWVAEQQKDSRNLLSTISLDGTNIDSRSYDTGGRLSSETLGNGLVVTRTYMTGDNLPLAISNSVVGTYTYAWDANKNKTGETITGALSGYTSSMGFDDQNRLTSWNRSNGNSQAWTLSAVNDWQSFTNNGTAVARTHGPTHEVLTVGSATITHDSRGNMTGDEFLIARTYDADNKVSQAIVPAGSPRGVVGTHTYQYDVLGRRVRKTIGGASPSDTVFSLAGEQVVADYPAGAKASSPTTKYLWGSYIDELVCQAAGSSRLYLHRNQQYSTIALSDANGAVSERYSYTSYGDLTVLDPAGTTIRTTPPQSRYTYTGREYDHETGTYHFRARIYSATLGRFDQHDPILYPDGWNTYAGWFSGCEVDPTGKFLGFGYGNFCGFSRRAKCPPGTSGKQPIDAVDAACERHDCCLMNWYDCWKVTWCDSSLCSEVWDAYHFGCIQSYPGDKKKQNACKHAADTIASFFCWGWPPSQEDLAPVDLIYM